MKNFKEFLEIKERNHVEQNTIKEFNAIGQTPTAHQVNTVTQNTNLQQNAAQQVGQQLPTDVATTIDKLLKQTNMKSGPMVIQIRTYLNNKLSEIEASKGQEAKGDRVAKKQAITQSLN